MAHPQRPEALFPAHRIKHLRSGRVVTDFVCWAPATRAGATAACCDGMPHKNCEGRLHQIALISPATLLGRRKAMQLSQMWREHLQAGCPPEMRGLSIAGTAARELDAEITACVSACVTHSLKMDSRIERRLHDIAQALENFQGQATPEVAAYCTRLNKLVSAVLVNAGPVVEAAKEPGEAANSDTVRTAVRPGLRRR